MHALLLVGLLASAPAVEAPRLLVMDLSAGKGIEKDTAQTFTEFTTAYLSESTQVVVVSKRDIARIADLEADKQQQGCENSDVCMAEIAGALGARFVVFGRISKLGDSTFVHVTLVDVQSGQPLARKVVSAQSLDELATALHDACVELGAEVSAARSSSPRPPSSKRAEQAPRFAEPDATPAKSDAGGARGTKVHVPEVLTDDEVNARTFELRKAKAADLHQAAQGKLAVGGAVLAGGVLVGTGALAGSVLLFSQNSSLIGPAFFGAAGGCCLLNVVTGVVGGTALNDAGDLDSQAKALEARPQRY